MDAVGLRDLIRTGAVTAAEVEALARRALEQVNAELNGLTRDLFDLAPADELAGPFAGVPFVIKDSGPFARGGPFTVGSNSIQGAVAVDDHELMTRFRAAGLVLLGQSTAPEFGLNLATEPVGYGVTRNPWALDRGVGGSSGGAAALVAAGAVPLAHAGDAGGSIRVPASCCGLVGLKPSRGRTPSGPLVAEAAFGQLVEFGLTRTVRDAAHLLDAVCAPLVGEKYQAAAPTRPYADHLHINPERLRVAISTAAWSGGTVDPQVVEATTTVGKVLEWVGHSVVEDRPEFFAEDVVEAAMLSAISTGGAILNGAPARPGPALLEAVSRRLLVETEVFSALDVMKSMQAQHLVTRSIGQFFLDYDMLLTPTTICSSPRLWLVCRPRTVP